MKSPRLAIPIGVAALVLLAGCGGSSGSRATPPTPSSASSTAPSPTTRLGPAATLVPATQSTVAGNGSSAALGAVAQQLQAAGSDISASTSAIAGSDVDVAKAQEGSAP